jgi:outer membrane lipoprotein carrier protein LolA
VKAGFAPCALALAAVALLGAAPVAKIQSILAKPKVLCGRFDQSKQLVGLKNPVTSNGRFCVLADKGVLWRSLQPFPTTLRLTRDQIVQTQGDRVMMRLDAQREPAVQMINNVLFALLAGDLAQLEKLFIMEGNVHDRSWSVALKAREPGLAKAIGGIALEGGVFVKSITISEANGDITKIVFSAIQTGDGAMTADEAAMF